MCLGFNALNEKCLKSIHPSFSEYLPFSHAGYLTTNSQDGGDGCVVPTMYADF